MYRISPSWPHRLLRYGSSDPAADFESIEVSFRGTSSFVLEQAGLQGLPASPDFPSYNARLKAFQG